MQPKPKSILLIGNFLSERGGNRGISEELMTRLREIDWHVLYASDQPNKILRLLDMVFKAIMHRGQYQLAHIDVFSGPAFIFAEVLGRLFNWLHKPFVCTLRGGNLPVFEKNHPRRVQGLLSRAAQVVTPSRFLYTHFLDICENITIIPNGIELSRYPFQYRENPEAKLIWLRAFHNIYNPSMVPKVLDVLRSKGILAICTMIGPDKGDNSLQFMLAEAIRLKIMDQITIIPGVPKVTVPDVIREGDIFLNTTNFDNTPVSVIEAMACGLCVVSTDVGGLPYLLEHNVDALLVPPEDITEMATAVQRVLSEPGLAKKLSTNARKKAQQFDWSAILPQWESIFTSLIRYE